MGEACADACRVVAYANGKTLSRPNMRAALERVGVEIVEVGDVAEAADERLMTDVYSRARDAADAGALATVVVTCDARLRVCVEQARVRGVFTVVVSDFLRTWRLRDPSLSISWLDFPRVRRCDDDDDDEAYARACASSARVENSSKIQNSRVQPTWRCCGIHRECSRRRATSDAYALAPLARRSTISVDPPPRPAASSANSPIETSRLGPPRASPPRITSVRSAHSRHRLALQCKV